MMDAKKRTEELASKLDCTWNGEQGRWVSENLIKMAIEEAKREERIRAAKIAKYAIEREADSAKYYVEPAAIKAGVFIASAIEAECDCEGDLDGDRYVRVKCDHCRLEEYIEDSEEAGDE